MQNLDEELKNNHELRLSIKSVLAESLRRVRRSIGFKSLTREERRGMFSTHLRTCVGENLRLKQSVTFYQTTRSGHIIQRKTDRLLHPSVLNHIMSKEIWYDAGVLREGLPSYLESPLLRNVMENVMEESEDGENLAKTSISKLEGGIAQMELNMGEIKTMRKKLEDEANRLTAELSKL